MSIWTIDALIVTVAFALCGMKLVRATPSTSLVVLQLATTVASIDMLLVAQAFGNAAAFDAALMLAILSYPAGLLFARFYGRWLE